MSLKNKKEIANLSNENPSFGKGAGVEIGWKSIRV